MERIPRNWSHTCSAVGFMEMVYLPMKTKVCPDCGVGLER